IGDKASLEQTDKLAPSLEKAKVTKDAKQKSIKFEYRCKGKQEPKVTWRKSKTEIKDTPNKYKISKKKETDDTYVFTLDVLNATPADGGVYKILAKNDAGDAHALINLNVDAEAQPPYIDLLDFGFLNELNFYREELEPSETPQKKPVVEQPKILEAPIPTIAAPLEYNADDRDRLIPTIQTDEPLYEEAGPRRASTA
ncbi:unnamed protein product, partial [Rotaria magnacalcarata]